MPLINLNQQYRPICPQRHVCPIKHSKFVPFDVDFDKASISDHIFV